MTDVNMQNFVVRLQINKRRVFDDEKQGYFQHTGRTGCDQCFVRLRTNTLARGPSGCGSSPSPSSNPSRRTRMATGPIG